MPDVLLKNITLADKEEKRVAKSVGQIEKEVWSMIQDLLNSFDTKDGKFVTDEKAKALLAQLNKRLRKIIDTSGLENEMRGFLDNFDEIEDNLKTIHKSLNGIVVPESTLTKQKAWAIDNTLFTLKEANVNLKFMDPLRRILYTKVNFGSTLIDTEKQLRQIVLGDPGHFGILTRWIGQVTRDAFNKYEGVINQEIKVKYDMDAVRYVGPILEDSRPQCIRWVEMGIIPDTKLQEEIDWAFKNGKGMMPDTDTANFCVNCGGFNCIHSAYPTFIDGPKKPAPSPAKAKTPEEQALEEKKKKQEADKLAMKEAKKKKQAEWAALKAEKAAAKAAADAAKQAKQAEKAEKAAAKQAAMAEAAVKKAEQKAISDAKKAKEQQIKTEKYQAKLVAMKAKKVIDDLKDKVKELYKTQGSINSVKINETGLFKNKTLSGNFEPGISSEEKAAKIKEYQSIGEKISKEYKKTGGLNKLLEANKDQVQTIKYEDLTPFQSTVSPKKIITKLEGKDNNKYLPVVFKVNGKYILEGGTHRTVASILKGEKEGKFIVIDLDKKSGITAAEELKIKGGMPYKAYIAKKAEEAKIAAAAKTGKAYKPDEDPDATVIKAMEALEEQKKLAPPKTKYKPKLGKFQWTDDDAKKGRATAPTTLEAIERLGTYEKNAIKEYSGSGYTALNEALREGLKMDGAIRTRDKYLNLALKQLPKHVGVVVRGERTSGNKVHEEMIASMTPGAVVTMPAYTSSSYNYGSNFSGDILYFIKSKTGVNISKYSRFQSEDEVLFNRGTKFIVLHREKSPYGNKTVIYLEEL